jgi:PIN domain nuclease of toxin-antitoxin system
LATPERLLLDTHAFVWALQSPGQLGERLRQRLTDGTGSLFVSTVSAWELSTLVRKGRIELPDASLGEFVLDGISTLNASVLPLRIEHVLAFHDLPAHHKDPFDRMLIAQALHEHAVLATVDETIRRHYDVEVFW